MVLSNRINRGRMEMEGAKKFLKPGFMIIQSEYMEFKVKK